MPIYQLWDFPLQIPILGGIWLFSAVLFIYAFDFLIDVKFWEKKEIGHFAVFKLLAKIWIAISLVVSFSALFYLFYSNTAKAMLVGDGIRGFLNADVAAIVLLIGVYILFKLSNKPISGLFFIGLFAGVSALAINIPTYMLSNQDKFRLQTDLYDPILGFFALFMMNLLTVSFFEKEKDLEGNTKNIWNTNEKIAKSLMYIIPVATMLAYWLFKWNATLHPMFFVMFVYMLMYFIPKYFRIASIYRILADITLLLMFVKIKW